LALWQRRISRKRAEAIKNKNLRPKYAAQPTTVDGIRFASKSEAKYYISLKEMEKLGEVTDIQCHPKWPVVINDTKVCDIELDFQYKDKNGELHYVDVKGMDTPVSALKRKLLYAVHGIETEIVKAVNTAGQHFRKENRKIVGRPKKQIDDSEEVDIL